MGGSDRTSGMLRRAAYALNLAVFLIALLTLAVVVNYFGHRPEARLMFDATKTRAYSLSPQTRELLDELEGDWTIALVLDPAATDASTRQQVDEVLRRYEDASPAITVERIDPTDSDALIAYEGLLARLREMEGDALAEYEQRLDAATVKFNELQVFAQQQVAQLELAMAGGVSDEALRADLGEHVRAMGLLAAQGNLILEPIAEARAVTDTRPIPDYETARSILAAVLSQYADEFVEVALLFERWRDTGITGNRLRLVREAINRYRLLAVELADGADGLVRLPYLELASIGRRLETGEVIVVLGPDRAAVIPSEQLFPKVNLRAVGETSVAFDRRFRGEQVISASIRSLLVPQMPMVVFVHAERTTMMQADAQNADVTGVAQVLDASRFRVREWSVTRTSRPVPAEGQAVVWIVMPPKKSQGREPSKEEFALVRTVESLISEGEAVLLNVNPSTLQRYRLQDPWQPLAAPFGLRPQTDRVVLEVVSMGQQDEEIRLEQAIDSFTSEHPICRAAHGQRALFPLPVPIAREGDADAVHSTDVASVEPSQRRWLETDWARVLTGAEAPVGVAIEHEQPIMVAAVRTNPETSRLQRFLLVGSGSWLRSYVTELATGMGGDRIALTNPGNHELALASVAWLAGMDELIAPSPISQQYARLDGIGQKVAVRWGLLAVVGAPLVCLLLGLGVWLARRF